MDEFILNIDKDKFRATNSAWNSLMLNSPWSVGYVTSLIETQAWSSKEEWANFYYESGEERIKLTPPDYAQILNDFELIRSNSSMISSLSSSLKNLNFNYGRTLSDLENKAKVLHENMITQSINISFEDCLECVKFRIIGETWNGVIIREKNTIIFLQKLFPSIEFRKTTGDIDHAYAVDYELYKNDNLLAAIQIKPQSYATGYAHYLVAAREANRKKNLAYTSLNKVPVMDIISKSNGEILNPEVIQTLKKVLL